MQTFPYEGKPQTEKFLVSDEHSHIEYVYYLKKQCMSPVRFERNVWKLVLNFVCVSSPSPTNCRPFRRKLNPKLKNSWYQMNTHILNICIISKTVHVSGTFSRYLWTFLRQANLDVWKLVSVTLNSVRIKSVAHKIVQAFSQQVKLQTTKFLVLDEHLHINYTDYGSIKWIPEGPPWIGWGIYHFSVPEG